MALDCLEKSALGSREKIIRRASDWMLDKQTGSVNVSGETSTLSEMGELQGRFFYLKQMIKQQA